MKKKSVKILLYPVTIKPCEEGGLLADCFSFQGCHAEGDTYSEVIENIEDVIKAHIEIRKQHGILGSKLLCLIVIHRFMFFYDFHYLL